MIALSDMIDSSNFTPSSVDTSLVVVSSRPAGGVFPIALLGQEEVTRRIQLKLKLINDFSGKPLINHFRHRMSKDDEVEANFWRRVEVMESGCWYWKRRHEHRRYGQTTLRGRTVQAHKVSFALTFPELYSEELYGLHQCDNTWCVRPDHIFLGSQLLNVRDMAVKGRDRKALGSNSGVSILTEGQVVEIKKLLGTGRYFDTQIAKKFGVARSTINHIKYNRSWAHICV